MSPESRNELLSEKYQQCAAYGCQDKVVRHKQAIQFERLPIAHKLSATKNDRDVCHNHGNSFSQG
jgi:hypothetical protein